MAEKTEEVHHDLNTGSRSVSPGGIYTTGRAGSRLGFWKVSDLEPEWHPGEELPNETNQWQN